jgi:isoleucyl-tRNA synthetase
MYEMFKDDTKASASSENVLDRWIVSRLNELIHETTEGFKNYELDRATRPITDFIDDVSVWYLRRSRDRFKGDDSEDKKSALATLRHILQNLALVMAPSMPFYAEYLWQAVKEDEAAESVHLAQWPMGREVDSAVIGKMAVVRDFVTLALEERTKVNIKVRQPLSVLYTNVAIEPQYAAIIAEEINVKEVAFAEQLVERVKLDTIITPELKAEGDVREFIRAVQDLRKQAGLMPSDRVALTAQTSDGGQALLTQFKVEIMKVVGAEDIVFADAVGSEVKAGDHSLTVQIVKVS